MNHLPVSKKFLPLHPQSRNKHRFEKAKCRNATKDGPFVYRLGLKIRLVEMANHKSSLKRIRQEETRRLHNRYYGKTMRNAVRKLRATTDKAEAVAMYPGITKMLDKLAKVNIIHKNKASNLKSKLALYINKLA